MLSRSFCLLGLFILSQDAFCGPIGTEEQVESLMSSLIEPIEEIKRGVNDVVTSYNAMKTELEEYKELISKKLEGAPEGCYSDSLEVHANLLKNWSLDGCLELTEDWKNGLLLGIKAAINGITVGNSLWQSAQEALSCSSKGIFNTLPCYYDSFKKFKKDIENIQKDIMPIISQARTLLVTLKKDYDSCVGIPYKIKEKIEKDLVNCQQQ